MKRTNTSTLKNLFLFTIFLSVLLSGTNSYGQANSIRTGATFNWADTQTNTSDPATLESIDINGTSYTSFAVPSTYEMTILGPSGHGSNHIMENGIQIVGSSNVPNWDADALSAYQDLNLNHYFECNGNGDNFCEDYSQVATTNSQIQTISYSPGIPSNPEGVLAVTERGGNNCIYIQVWGIPNGGGTEQQLGQTFVRNQGNLTGVGPQEEPKNNSDYWSSGRNHENNQVIAVALYELSELAPVGSTITQIKYYAASTDNGDGKFFIMQAYAQDECIDIKLDRDGNGDTSANDNVPAGSTYSLVSGTSNGTLTLDSDGTYNYQPNPGYSGTDSFEYQVCLPAPNQAVCDTATVCIGIGPDALVDSAIVESNSSNNIVNVLSNDIFGSSGPQANNAITDNTNPPNGTVTLNNNGTPGNPLDDYFQYTPNGGFEGTDAFTYEITDADGNTATATVLIYVAPDSEDDDIPDPMDLDDDNDGILDSNESQECIDDDYIQWGLNSPIGVRSVDFVQNPAITNWLLTSTGNIATGAGLNSTSPGSELQITSLDAYTYEEALANNEYIQVSFTTGSDISGQVIERLGINWYRNSDGFTVGNSYDAAIAISSDNFATSHVLNTDVQIHYPSNGISEFFDLLPTGTTYYLEENTTYAIRLYAYNQTNDGTVAYSVYDDFTVRFSGCQDLDTDSDGIPNHLEGDSDADGCADAIEAGHTDGDGDNYIGNSPVSVDSNGVVTGQGGYTGVTGNETIATQVTLNTSPSNLTTIAGNPAVFEIDATALNTTSFSSGNPNYGSGSDSSGQLRYQWQENGVNLSEGGNYNGTQTSRLTIIDATGLDGNTYTVIVTHLDNNCTNETRTATLTVNNPCDPISSGNVDTDGDGIADVCDLDDDNDGILDLDENSCILGSNPSSQFDSFQQQWQATGATVIAGNRYSLISNGSDLGTRTVTGGPNDGLTVTVNQFDTNRYTDLDGNSYDYPTNTKRTNGPNINIGYANISASQYPRRWTFVAMIDVNGNGQYDPLTDQFISKIFTEQGRLGFEPINSGDVYIVFTDDMYGDNGGNLTFNVETCVDKDSDNDGIPDRLDLDSDNDGIYDAVEAGHSQTHVNGRLSGGVDADGIPNTVTDNEGAINYNYADADNDGLLNSIDPDSDNDNCVDAIEAGHTDGDGDNYIGNSPLSVDSNGAVTGQGGYTGVTGNETIATQVTLNTAPINQMVNNGGSVSFSIDLDAINTTNYSGGTPDYGSGSDSSGQLRYQWQENGTNLSNGGVYSGVNTSTLTISNTSGLDNNTYTVLVTHLNNRCFALDRTATLSITPEITINDSSTVEGTNNVFTITSSAAISQDVVFNISYSNISTTDADYSGPSTVILPANDTSVSFNVLAEQDTFIEPTETHEVEIAYASGGTVNITDNEGRGEILDDDGGAGNGLSFDNTNVVVNEADGTATFTVRLTGNVPGGFTVNYATSNDTALADTGSDANDYTNTSNTLTFLGNDNESFDIVVPITDDNIHELTQSFNLNLSGLSTTLITINDPVATGTIIDNDSASIFNRFVVVFENDLVYNLEVELNAPVEHSFTVDFETFGNENAGLGGTATVGADYVANVNTTFTFPANSPAGTILSIPITVLEDAIIEPNETIIQVLDNISDPTIGILSPNRTFTINDDDSNSSNGISVADFSENESIGTANFVVSSNVAVSEAYTVNYTISNGSAIRNQDFTVPSMSGTLNFSGTLNETVNIPISITDDTILENNENLFITLSNISNALVSMVDANGIGNIIDNDGAGITVDLSANTAVEG
ncbi:Calx-beta domain-containing protein, partial [Croceitalea sp. P059]|uniref:Calx-beta domain-containing protein n=1 Tax=Croceitalea sp. P059 TaxID=3075601 RepID=UPI002886D5B1